MKGWKIARIHGVDLKVHISLIFILFYIALVAGLQFPTVLEQSGLAVEDVSGNAWVWGIVFALALFTSVTLHEYGHVIIAQALNVKVKGVTLMMLGGVSEIEQMSTKPYQEFKIAVVGPIVSLGIAGALYLLQLWTTSASLYFFAYWLSRVNLVLGMFNLLPAFPMDGGRVFRSLLTVKFGHFKATRVAVKVGQGFAIVFGIFGFLQLNIILMLIAVIIYMTAQTEWALLVSKMALKGVRAGEVGLRVLPISPANTLKQAAEHMMRTKSFILPVETGQKEGMLLRLEDMRAVDRNSWSSVLVKDVMQSVLRRVDVNEVVQSVFDEIQVNQAIPMVENERIVGVLRATDLAEVIRFKALEQATPNEQNETKKAA